MNLWQRLMLRRVYNEMSSEGGEGGGGNTTDTQSNQQNTPPAESNDKAENDKPVDDPNPKETDKKTENDKSLDVPEKYEFKANEGQELDATALKEFEPIARELNLNNEQAQKLVDLYGAKIMPQILQQQSESWQQQTESWAQEIKNDKTLGSTQSIGAAQKAMDTYGSPELKQYLNETGLGNHPELVRIFANIGKAMSEDGLVTGNNNGQISTADVLFGDSQ